MFKITVARDVEEFRKYMDYDTMGMMMGCYEEDKITGGICFDIENEAGYIRKMRADDESMKQVIAKAALNFMELHGIYDVYVKDDEFYKTVGFTDAGNGMLYINLDGYFTKNEGDD